MWQTQENLTQKPPKALHRWLFDSKRLGKSLLLAFPNIKLKKLAQYNGSMLAEEQQLLSEEQKECHIRLISHHIKNENIVLARTIIPQKTYLQYKDTFDNLNDQSIGESFLFPSKQIRRSQFYIKTFTPREVSDLFNLSPSHIKNSIWARASIFHLSKAHRLLIEEFFLVTPDIVKRDGDS